MALASFPTTHQWLAPLYRFLGLGAPQSLTGAGAVDPYKRITYLTSSGVAQALTLADGLYQGQVKEIVHEVDGGSSLLTPANPEHFATITFTAVHDFAKLVWTGTKWRILSYGGVTIA